MDFHSMKRKELQSLCKKYSIPANLSNLAMAKKLSELLKEKEEPLIRGRSCLKGPDDNVSETESDVVENKKVKKVRFSPDHELIEFTRSREVKGKRRRKSTLRDNSLSVEIVNNEKVVAENINIPGQVTRPRGQKLMGGVNKQRGRTLAKIDDVKDILASIDVETEKACEKKIDRPDRVMRSRRRTLVDLLVNENNRGRNGVDSDVVLANVEREESRAVIRRALRNRETVDGDVKENMKENEEVLENTEIVEENVNLEPQIVLRRSKRNAKKVEDEGARKYQNDRRQCSRKRHNELRVEASKFDADSATETEVEVEGKPDVEEDLCLEDPAKVQLRRSNRCKNTTDSHGKMGNDEPVVVNKGGYQMSALIETGTSTGVLKEDVKVAHLTGGTRRSRRRTVISQSVVETHKNLDDETIENGKLREPTREPCLVEDGLGREENTRRSRRIASKHEPATMMDELDGKANVPGKNEARKRKRVCVSGEHVTKTEDDPTEKPLIQSSQNAIGSEKATHIAFKGKISQKRKQQSRVEKPNLVEASLEDMSKIAESFSVDAQLSMPQVVEISNNAAFSCTGIAMNITSDARQTSVRKAHGKKRDASVEVSAESFDTREVNGSKLENRENSSASENVILQIDNLECDLEISVSKSMEVEDNFHAPLEIAVENSFEDNKLNINKDGSAAALLFCQAEDFSCINTLGEGEHTSDLNITGNSGFPRVISSTNGFTLVNESESTTKLEVMEAKSANKTIQQSLNVVEDEVDIVKENLDQVELGVNELTLPIYSCPSDVDHLAASNQRFEKDNEDTATKATEDDVLDPCGKTGHKTYIKENNYAEDPGFSIKPVAETSLENNVSSVIHCSDHIEGEANSMKARILEERKLSLSEHRLCADTDNVVIGEDTFLQKEQNSVEYAKNGEGELSKKYGFIEQPCHGDKSNTAIPWNNIIEDPGKFASAGTILGINYFSSSDQLDVPAEDIDAFGLEGASEQKKQLSGTIKQDQRDAYDMIEEDETFVHEDNLSDLAEIVKDECFKNHETTPQISISNLFDGEKSARTISQDVDICHGEDSFKNADMLSKIADSSATASPAMFGYCTEININASSSCSMEASLFRPNSALHSLVCRKKFLGNAGIESHNEKREDGSYSTKESCAENSVSIIQKDAVVGRTVDSDRKRFNIMDKLDSEKINASVSEGTGGEEIVAVGSGEETWSKQSNDNGIEILQPFNCSQQGPAAVDEDKSFLLITPMKGRDANPVGELNSLLAKHVDAADIIQEKETLSIGSKTAGFATSVHTIISKGDGGTHSQANESSEDGENEPGLLVNLFCTPVGIENATQNKNAWSIGSKATRDTKSLDKTTSKGADESSSEDKNENPFNSPAIYAYPSEGKHADDPAEVVDVGISMDIACNKVEFESQFGLATGSLDSEIDSSVSKDITGKEFDTGGSGEESCSKQINDYRVETLHPISGAQQAPATADEELKSPFATHVGDANTIPENEALSTGSKTAGEALSLYSTISKGDYGILGQVNESPEDDANKTGLLINLFATPVGNVNTIQKKEAWSTGIKSAGDTMSLEKTTSKGADESNKYKNENQLQNSFNFPANNAKPSEEKHDHDPAEIVDVAISMDIVCTTLEFESHFALATESMDSEKIDVSVSEDIRGEEIDADGSGEESWSNQSNALAATDEDLKSQFATRVGDANTIRENEALSIGSKTAKATSVHSTISKGEYVILRQENESPEDDANEPGLVKSQVDNPVGVVNTTQEKEAWRIGSEAAGDTMSLDKTASKGEHEILSQDDESFSKDRNEIGDVAMHVDSACNKMGFESYSQMKSHKTEEEECRIQIEHAADNMVSYNEHEFNNLFDTPMDSTNCGPPNETFCHRTERGDLTMPADKFVSKMVSAEFFDRNFQATEGEKESKNEKTVPKCAVQQAPSQEVSATSSDVGSEEDQLKVLFATPVNSATPCKENETFGRNASAAEQNANSEMAMKQSAVFQELNECSNNAETQYISAEAKETHNTFQNVDNIDADYGAESPMLSYLEMQLPLKENKEVENSEADTSNFDLVHDHLKDSKEVEENSNTMLTKQKFEMPDHQSEDNVEFRSGSLAGSVLSVSGCHETLKESDIADTIKAYIDFESTASVGVDDPTHVVESIDNEHANLVEPQAQSHLKLVNADEENDKHTIANKTRKVEEEMQLVESARESKETGADPAIDGGYAANNALIPRKKIRWDNQTDSPGSGLKERSTTKNIRAILIHGTPNKAIMRGNMKENAPDSKRDNIGNLTTVRPAKRRALQDLQWK